MKKLNELSLLKHSIITDMSITTHYILSTQLITAFNLDYARNMSRVLEFVTLLFAPIANYKNNMQK